MTNPDSKKRFSDRVEDYRKYRPRYPGQLVDTLKSICSLNPESVIGDVGSGTGILTELLLPHCKRVYAIEPNPEMRHAAEVDLGSNPRFVSTNGSAEETTLPDHWVDMIVAAQAFHWFDRIKTKAEFERIIVRGGWIVLIWNSRRVDADEFHTRLEHLLTASSPEYSVINHKNIGHNEIADFFSPHEMKYLAIPNEQVLDSEGLLGRLLSASYVPKEGKLYENLINEAGFLFEQFQTGGKISIQYTTEIFLSRT